MQKTFHEASFEILISCGELHPFHPPYVNHLQIKLKIETELGKPLCQAGVHISLKINISAQTFFVLVTSRTLIRVQDPSEMEEQWVKISRGTKEPSPFRSDCS